MCRAVPRLSAATIAQKPAGSVMPPLPGSHVSAAARVNVGAADVSTNSAIDDVSKIFVLIENSSDSIFNPSGGRQRGKSLSLWERPTRLEGARYHACASRGLAFAPLMATPSPRGEG